MSDFIGRIPVPAVPSSGLTFPLVTDFGYGFSQDQPVVVHRFGDLDAKSEQRYAVGLGARKHSFKRANLSKPNRDTLAAFWESLQGPWQSFTYNVPNADQSTTATTVIWEDAPLSFEYLQNAVRSGLNFVEVPSLNPSYTVTETDLRFPSSTLNAALLSQVQQIIPLVHIRVREAAVPDIYLSDRRCTVGGQAYLPRVIGLGEQGSEVILTQDLKGSADTVNFNFGNADQVMTDLANDTDLKYAQIDLCLFHVNTGILLQLWKGFIQTFTVDGSATFAVQASDGIFQINQQHPPKTASRTCWKTYDDGLNCPWATQGASGAAVIAAGGDPASCDYYWNSPNGCQVHGMTRYFGGIPILPQSVNVKDNSTGFLGFDRNTVTATSIISDTIWGQALAEIWCNQGSSAVFAFIVNALIAAVRDNGDYFDVLGIIGAGPLGAFTIQGNAAGSFVTNADGFTYLVAPLADGLPAQGLKISSNGTSTSHNSALGLRQAVGNDPIPTGDQGAEQFDLANIVGQNSPPLPFAAGTAFCELLYPKPSGITPSATDTHSMAVPIAQGLTGFTWDASDVRTAVPGLIDPFWIAINTFLRALGMQNATSAQQEAMFVRSSVFKGDGTGCAEIADTMVTPILGTGTELQYQFQGSLGTQKPLRDWLQEILNCGLGFFTWEFGKLKLGCRINASSVDTYTAGNMKFQSLRLTPFDAAFEHLIIDFADVEYQYQANTADYQDKSHAAYYGRAGAPLTQRMHSVGSPTLSQNLRIAATRTREELGGVNAAEWRNARNASWQTTLLGLANEVGQVVSITDPKVPGLRGTCNVDGSGNVTFASGDAFDPSMANKDVLINGVQYGITSLVCSPALPDPLAVCSGFSCTPTAAAGTAVPFKIITGDFRIQSWQLRKDYSISISAKTVTRSMYTLEIGPQPIDVLPQPLPALFFGIPWDAAWAPYQIQASANDALFPGEWTFDSDQEYTDLADGGSQASLIITGKLPVDEFSPGVGAPVIGSIVVNTTGGLIPGGLMLRVTVCAIDGTGLPSAPSLIALVQTPVGTNTNQIVLDGIVWPPSVGLASFVVFASTEDDLICAQQTGALTALGGGITYTPASIVIDGPFIRSTWALPSPYVDKIRIKAKPSINNGVAGMNVDSVSTNTLVCSFAVGSTNSWPGRALSVIGRRTGSTPYASYLITAFDSTTGAFSVFPDPVGTVLVDDALVIRTLADAPNNGSGVCNVASGNVTRVSGAALSVAMLGQGIEINGLPYAVATMTGTPPTSFTTTPAAVTGTGLAFEMTTFTSISDAGYINSIDGGGLGLVPGQLVGELIRVVKGLGRGTPPRKILANTTTGFTWDLPMPMDSTSVWIIEGAAWPFSVDSTAIQNASPLTPVTFIAPAGNYLLQPMVIAGFTVDINGVESPDGDAPIREDWIYGSLGTLKPMFLALISSPKLATERTSLLQSLAVASDVAPHVVAYPGGTLSSVVGTLRKAIAADLVVNLNVVTASTSTLLGTFTIPSSTAINTPIVFTSFAFSAIGDYDVLSWDVTASDGSSDVNGVVSYSAYWS
jgi:hypothetical protein